MFYALNKNVYIVNGNAGSCIYDFNSSRLYHLNKMLSDKINLVNQGQICAEDLDYDLKNTFMDLLKLGVLILSEEPVTQKIDEIKEYNSDIKFAWIEITNKCNLRCVHCYNESDLHCSNSMSLPQYKLAIDKLLDLGIEKVQIIGGEPLLCQETLRDMLDYTIGKFRMIEVFTNGTLISDDWIDYFADNNIHLALSVYSYEGTMHDKVTGQNGSWAKTNRTIQALKKHNISYRICNILMKDVEIGKKSTELYELSEQKDVVRMSGRASFSLLSDELIRKKLITRESFQNPIQKHFVSRLLSGHNCFNDKLYISADMQVYPCVMERRLKHGIVDEREKIILNDSIRSMNKDRIKGCNKCEYRYACFDCRPDSIDCDPLGKPWYCTYNPLTGKWENENDFIAKLKRKWGNGISL